MDFCAVEIDNKFIIINALLIIPLSISCINFFTVIVSTSALGACSTAFRML